MNYLLVGKIVNTHGIKGEVKLISSFERKDLVFKKNFNVYIGKNKEQQVINSYRVHKNFDMITFKNIVDINEVLKYKNEFVYINRNDLNSNIILKDDFIGYSVIYMNKCIGILDSFFSNKIYEIMVIKGEKKEYLVPYLDNFIEKICNDQKQIYIKKLEGLIDEN